MKHITTIILILFTFACVDLDPYLPEPDTTPPAEVNDFTAIGADSQIILTFTMPNTEDLRNVRITRKTTDDIGDYQDGHLICNDCKTNMIDSGLDNDQTYYYKAFTSDFHNNYSNGVSTLT